VEGSTLCLVGPGDSTKTTILDAIEYALFPRWNLLFYDSDFYDANIDNPIKITVTVGQIPEKLKSENKYGLECKGWNETEGIHDEPKDGDDLAIAIQLMIDKSLEPLWRIVNDRNPDGVAISAKDRQLLGISRLSSYVDRELNWGRDSILSRFTGKIEDLNSLLADSGRIARSSINTQDLTTLNKATERIKEVSGNFGVIPRKGFNPHLDFRAVHIGDGGFSLHDGEIPFRKSGLGSKRLLIHSLQNSLAVMGGIRLVDEIELGLEPHRINRVLNVLGNRSVKTSESSDQIFSHGQLFLTTHSPVVIVELNSDEICVVRNKDGIITVCPVGRALQDVVRSAPQALLGRKIIVCEGKTEIGICRALDNWWSNDQQKYSFAYQGVVLVDGGGASAPSKALKLHSLGYPIFYICDSEVPLSPPIKNLEETGICVAQWEGNLAIEGRIVNDLPWQGVIELVSLAMDIWPEESIRQSIISFLKGVNFQLPDDISLWEDSSQLRQAMSIAADKFNDKKGWFKRISSAETLGKIIIKYLPQISATDLSKKIVRLRSWVDKID
jgi:hypothetical protein